MAPLAARALSLEHLLRAPQSGPAPHPAIICLHGRGSNEADLIGLAPYLDDCLFWISPRAPLDIMGGYEWYRMAGIGLPVQPTFEAAQRTLDQFITEAVAAYPVDPKRLYLMGFSQGSMMSYAFALGQPGRVAGVIAQSGYIPLTSGIAVDEPGLKGKPFIITHGLNDPLIPVQWGRDARDWLARAGADVEYHDFPMGHSVSDESLAAVAQWMRKRLAENNGA